MSTPSYTYNNGVTESFAGTAPVSTVSVGTADQELPSLMLQPDRDHSGFCRCGWLPVIWVQTNKLMYCIAMYATWKKKNPTAVMLVPQHLAAAIHYNLILTTRFKLWVAMATTRAKCIDSWRVGYYRKKTYPLASGTTVSGDLMTNVGVSYKFGENKTLAKISPASYNALEQQVDTLEAQNKNYKKR